MSWGRVIEILVLFFLVVVTAVVNPLTGIIYIGLRAGLTSLQVFASVLAWTSLTLALTYYEVNQIKKWPPLRTISGRIEAWYSRNSFGRGNKKHRKRLVDHLVRQQKWVVIPLGFVPFVPYLPTAVIIGTKLLNIRCGVIFLLLGNAVRMWLYSNQIYQGLIRLLS